MTRALAISDTGLRLIKAFEGFRPDDRTLVTGVRVVGYGHRLDADAAPVRMSRADAEEQLLRDLEPVEEIVNDEVHAPLSQGQFDALCSLAFNIGTPAFRASELVRAMNNGRVLDAANGFDVWRKATVNGQAYVVDALMRRRTAEKSLFLRNEPAVPAPSAMLTPQADDGLRDVVMSDASGVIDGANIINADRVETSLTVDDGEVEITETPALSPTDETVETVIETAQKNDTDAGVDEEPIRETRAAPSDADEDLFDGIDEDGLVEVALDDSDDFDGDDFDDLSNDDEDDDFEEDDEDGFDDEDEDGFEDEEDDDFDSDVEDLSTSNDDDDFDDDFDDDEDDDDNTASNDLDDDSLISTASTSLGDRLSALLDSDETDTEDDALGALPTSLLQATKTDALIVAETELELDDTDESSRSNLVSFPKRELVLEDEIDAGPVISEATPTDTVEIGAGTIPANMMVIDDLAADDVLRASREPENPVFDPEGDPVENAMRYLERQALEKKSKKSSGGLWIPIVVGIVLVSFSAVFISRGGISLLSAWGPTASIVAAITGGIMLLFTLYALIRKWSAPAVDET
jgi:GH24 family phage-related lysozyme (muramidase)